MWKDGWIFFSSASVRIFTFSIVFFANQLPRKFATSAFRALKNSVTLLCSRYSRLLAGSYIRIGLAPGCRNLSARHCNVKRFYHDDIDNPGKYLNRTAHPVIGVCFGTLCFEISEPARKHPSTGIFSKKLAMRIDGATAYQAKLLAALRGVMRNGLFKIDFRLQQAGSKGRQRQKWFLRHEPTRRTIAPSAFWTVERGSHQIIRPLQRPTNS